MITLDLVQKRLQNTHNQEIEALKAKLADEKVGGGGDMGTCGEEGQRARFNGLFVCLSPWQAKIDKSNAEALKNIRDEKERNHKKVGGGVGCSAKSHSLNP